MAAKEVRKSDIDGILFNKNRDILNVLPEFPKDVLDQFLFNSIYRLARYNKGSGFEAIQAKEKLKMMQTMSYDELRLAAIESPDYKASDAAKVLPESKPEGVRSPGQEP